MSRVHLGVFGSFSAKDMNVLTKKGGNVMALKGNSYEEQIWNYLTAKGINAYGTAGLMGNLYAESGLKPNNLQNSYEKKLNITDMEYTSLVDNGNYPDFVNDKAGYGLAQWTYYTRKQALLNFVKARKCSIADLEAQLDFLWSELSGGYKGVLSAIRNANSVRSASDVVLKQFERPADQSEAICQKRASYGQTYYDKYASQKTGGANMANTVDKVINIALAEEGYLEKSAAAYKKDPSVLDRKTDGAGQDNYTKYGRDMHNIYPAVMDFPAYWCDCFVDWCFYKAYGVATAKSLLGGNFDDYTVASSAMYQKKGALDTTPTVGSQVFFTKNGQTSGCYHTGLVYAVDGTYFYTVEGNTSGASSVVSNGGGVAKKKYSIAAYKGKVLFGHPKYDIASGTTTTTTTTTTNNSSYYPTYTGKSGSITEALKAVGVDNSMANRTKIAAANGISNYSGTAAQNTQMLTLLKQGKLVKAGTTTQTTTQTTSSNSDKAQSYDKSIAGAYIVNTGVGSLNIRNGAGTKGTRVLRSVPKGKTVQNYGYYSTVDGVRWLYIQYEGTTGFMSSQYLKKK